MPQKGDIVFDVWFWSAAESFKKPDDGVQLVDGRMRWVIGARYAIWRQRWTGSTWRRFRRVTGPMRHADAVARLKELTGANRTGMVPAAEGETNDDSTRES